MNTKFFRYVFLILGFFSLADALSSFTNPKESYEIISFKVSSIVYILYKVFIAIIFILNFIKMKEVKK